MKKAIEINEELLRGVALVFDLAPEEVSSDEVECLLQEAIERIRDSHRDKYIALQEVISTQYIKYEPEETKHEAE